MVKIGVVGAGYLGKFHIQKLQNIKNCKLVAISDIDKGSLELYKNSGVFLTDDFKTIVKMVDAVSIVVPTIYHFEIAKFFIENGVHVFIEKPVTASVDECERLINLTKNDVIVQVGHIERFNPVYLKVKEKINNPKIMTFVRKAPFVNRGIDVDVVYDLMIHDIDLVLSFFKNKWELKNISVKGSKIITNKYDYLSANFFINDVYVNIQTSRVSAIKERKMTLVDSTSICEGDFLNLTTFYKSKDKEELYKQDFPYDALQEELSVFINSITNKKTPPVTLIDGLNSLKLAEKILQAIER